MVSRLRPALSGWERHQVLVLAIRRLRLLQALLEHPAMLCEAAADPFSPEAKARRLEFAPHEFYHLALFEAGAFGDFLETGPVLPGEADDLGDLFG